MTLVQKLDSALAELSIPFYPGYYEGNGKDYGVYDSITDEPAVFADDDNQANVSSCNVHLFVKEDKKKWSVDEILDDVMKVLDQLED